MLNAIVKLTQSIIPNLLILVLNQKIITEFGSDVNGILTTAAQVINFLTIFEAGFSLSTTVVLYNPYLENETNKINSILHATRVLYQKIGVIVAVLGIIISIIMPFIIVSNLSNDLITSIFLISVFNVSVTFIITMKYGIMFSVSQQEYKLNFLKLIFQSISQIVCIILIGFTNSIIPIRLLWFTIPFLALPFMRYLSKKNFPYLTFKSDNPDKEGIRSSKDVFAQKIAVLITNNTDLFVAASFLSTMYSSVYSVYYFVYAGLKQILFSFILAPFNAFGQLYAGNEYIKLRQTYKTYQFISIMLISIILTTGNIMIIPFVRIYTAGVVDINYINYPFALLISIAVFLELISNMMGVVVNSAGFFKKMKPIVLIGAAINIVVSILLVRYWKLAGIAFGTILSYLFMNVGIARILYKDILKTRVVYFIKYLFINIASSALLIYFAQKIIFNVQGYLDFVVKGFLVFFAVLFIFVIVNLISDRIEMKKFFNKVISVLKK